MGCGSGVKEEGRGEGRGSRRVGLGLGELGDVPSSTVWAVRYCFDWRWLAVVLLRDLEKLAIVSYPYMDFWLA